MNLGIYALLGVVVLGLFVPFFFFFKFLVSFFNLFLIAKETGRDRPWEHVLTGGFSSMWRVLRHNGNGHATIAHFRSLALFLGSIGVTIGAGFLLIDLNTKHCVLPMTRISSDGTVAIICIPSD